MVLWNKLIEYKEFLEKFPEFPHKSPEIPELSKWLGIANSDYEYITHFNSVYHDHITHYAMIIFYWSYRAWV